MHEKMLSRQLEILRTARQYLSQLSCTIEEYEAELRNAGSDYRLWEPSRARAAVKRGVIETKYRITSLVKGLYE